MDSISSHFVRIPSDASPSVLLLLVHLFYTVPLADVNAAGPFHILCFSEDRKKTDKTSLLLSVIFSDKRIHTPLRDEFSIFFRMTVRISERFLLTVLPQL